MKNYGNKQSKIKILAIIFLSFGVLSSNAFAIPSDTVKLENTVGNDAKTYTHKKGRKNAEKTVSFVSGKNVAVLKPSGARKIKYKCTKAGKGKYSILTLKRGRGVTVYMVVSCHKKKKETVKEEIIRRIETGETRINLEPINNRFIIRNNQ